MQIYIYTMDNCNMCDTLKNYLNLIGIPYNEIKVINTECVPENLKNLFYIINLPILKIDDMYYDSKILFSGETLTSTLPEIIDNYMEG